MASRFPAVSAISRPTAVEPVNETTATRGSSTSGWPASGAEALDDVQHARRQAGLRREAREEHRRLGRVLGGLQHGGVAAEERGKDLPGDVRDRRVRGDDQPGDAERLADRHGVPVRSRARHRPAVEAAPLAGDEVAELDRAVGLALRVLRRLAGLGGDERGDLVAIALEELGDPAEDPAALLDGARGPVRLRVGQPRLIAASTSVASERATVESTSPVAGASFSKVAPFAAGRSSPPITLGTSTVMP